MPEEREVIIDVEVEAKDFDKEIGSVNTKLRENNQNIKELSKNYKANSKEIAKLQADNRELSKSKQTLVKESKAESNSIDGLRLKLAAQTKQRNAINTATKEGAARFKTLNKEIKKNSDTLKEAEQAGGDFRRNVGNYGSALDRVVPGLGGVVTGIQGMTKAAIAFIATPLGLILSGIALAIAAVAAAFKGSEEGQNKFAKIMAVINVVLGNFQDLLADLGEAIISVFENPGQAVEDFGNLIKENIVNRFNGLLELLPALGNAISLLFEGNFAEAGKVALNAVVKVGLGVDDLTGKLEEASQAIINFGTQNVKEANEAIRVEQLRIEAREIGIFLLEEGAQIEAKIAKLKLQAREAENENIVESIQLLKDAQVLEQQLLTFQLSKAEKLAEAQKLENTFSRTNIENREKEAQAVNAVSLVEIQRAQSADGLQRRLNSLERRSEAETKAANAIIEKEAIRLHDEELARIEERFAKEEAILIKRLNLQADAEAATAAANQKKIDDEKVLFDLGRDLDKQALGSLKDSLSKGSKLSKATAIGEIAFDTGKAIASLTAASEGNPANAFTFGGAGIAQFVAGLVRIGTNIASAKKALSKSGGGAASVSSAGGGGASSGFAGGGLATVNASLLGQFNPSQQTADTVDGIASKVNINPVVSVVDITNGIEDRAVTIEESNLG